MDECSEASLCCVAKTDSMSWCMVHLTKVKYAELFFSSQASLSHQPPLFLLRKLTCQYILSRNIFNEPRRSGKKPLRPYNTSSRPPSDLPTDTRTLLLPINQISPFGCLPEIFTLNPTTQSKSCKLFPLPSCSVFMLCCFPLSVRLNATYFSASYIYSTWSLTLFIASIKLEPQ